MVAASLPTHVRAHVACGVVHRQHVSARLWLAKVGLAVEADGAAALVGWLGGVGGVPVCIVCASYVCMCVCMYGSNSAAGWEALGVCT